ncbi:MAG: hypothetical protein U0103_13620 [Candidatus Obscuribacterales bacterium]
MTAVAVWDRQPNADELLAWHIADGWTPQVSDLKDGSRVLGHAASCEVIASP